MAGSTAYARIKADVLAIVTKIPEGRLTTYGAIGRHLDVYPRHVAYVLTTLDDLDRTRVPWWRVVADGGAIGRHQRRDDHIARLKAEGIPVAPAGIAQELAERAIIDLANPPSGITKRPDTDAGKPSRSRGMKSHPGTSLK
jgi:methylated-DNA-protein-cysteine methyltransferase-like protein